MTTLRPELRACILHGPDPPLLFNRPDLRRGILRYPDGRRLHGSPGSGLCPRLFLRRPSLELLEQFLSDGLAGLGLALSNLDWSLTGLRLALIGRLTCRGSFVTRRRVRCRRRQILRGSNCLNGCRRRIGFTLKHRFIDPPIRHVGNERNRTSDRQDSDADACHRDSQNTGLENSRRDSRDVPRLLDIRLPAFFGTFGEKVRETIQVEIIICRHRLMPPLAVPVHRYPASEV
jgi:hypothetical protein